jgi:hypothetical protein
MISDCTSMTYCERLRTIASDSGRPVLAGLVQFRFFDRWFPCPERSADSLPTGPRGVLFGAIPLIRGNQSEACVHPLYFLISRRVSSEGGR